MPFDKEKLPIPEPRTDVPLDGERIRGQQDAGLPTNNPLVAEPEGTLDDFNIEPEAMSNEISDVPLSGGMPGVDVPDDFDGDAIYGVRV